jgi:hypothetical protein
MLLPFFTWLESLQLGAAVDESGYLIAAINVSHLLALAIFVGAALIVDLRLLGRGMTQQPLARVVRGAQPWLARGFAALAVTGILHIVATPMKVYYSENFWFKMQLLVVAVLFTFIMRSRIVRVDEARLGPFWGKAFAVVSITLWTTIAVQGRLIGLLQ